MCGPAWRMRRRGCRPPLRGAGAYSAAECRSHRFEPWQVEGRIRLLSRLARLNHGEEALREAQSIDGAFAQTMALVELSRSFENSKRDESLRAAAIRSQDLPFELKASVTVVLSKVLPADEIEPPPRQALSGIQALKNPQIKATSLIPLAPLLPAMAEEVAEIIKAIKAPRWGQKVKRGPRSTSGTPPGRRFAKRAPDRPRTGEDAYLRHLLARARPRAVGGDSLRCFEVRVVPRSAGDRP